jgi:hypothetical protein
MPALSLLSSALQHPRFPDCDHLRDRRGPDQRPEQQEFGADHSVAHFRRAAHLCRVRPAEPQHHHHDELAELHLGRVLHRGGLHRRGHLAEHEAARSESRGHGHAAGGRHGAVKINRVGGDSQNAFGGIFEASSCVDWRGSLVVNVPLVAIQDTAFHKTKETATCWNVSTIQSKR